MATIGLDPGETVVCTYTNTQDATIKIVKDAIPNALQDFAYTTTGTGGGTFGAGFSLDDDGGVTGADNTLPTDRTFTFTGADATGDKTVTETLPVTGWAITDLVCTGGGADTSTVTATGVATIGLDPGETVVCTYTNTQDATIKIVKDAIPNALQDFAYTTTGTGGGTFGAGFSLDDDGGVTGADNSSLHRHLHLHGR